jgi:DNA-binding winged helix-turn-helix (wHTH) protein/Tol biopolymer transport system component
MIAANSSVFRFDDVTVREREFAIVKAGQTHQVEPKAFQVLLILIRNPNKLITKEELLNSVWADVAVTENSLARNVALLRRLLGDDARESRFIETVTGLGYRFVCPVEVSEDRDETGAEHSEPQAMTPNDRGQSAHGHIDQEVSQQRKPRWLNVIGATVAVLAVLLILLMFALRRAPVRPETAWVQITDFPDSATSPALSPDGHMLAFIHGPDTFVSHGQIYIAMLPDGPPVQLTHDDLMKSSPAFSPDGSRIAYTTVDENWHWNTWVVPVLGGQPQEMLPNAASLTWVDRQRVMFSEMKSDFNMGIVSATESRTAEKDIYLPANKAGMAHRSWISPDHKWILIAEMDHVGWKPCRVLPFDGSVGGRTVGPEPARCRTAGWSPDGQTMYFGADAGDGYHIWSQRFPRGAPEQMTFGATQEEGIAISPDGRSLITSAGFITSTVWVHDEKGDRPVSREGVASLPGLGPPDDPWVHFVFSPDGKRLYYLLRKQGSRAERSGELWMADLDSGRTEAVLPGVLMGKFDILPDGQRVVFEAEHEDGAGHVWIAWLDRHVPPKMLTTSVARQPHLGAGGKIYMAVREGNKEFTYVSGPDEIPRKLDPPFPGVINLSPHGEWLLDGFAHLTARPVNGKSPVPICGYCSVGWGQGGVLYMRIQDNGDAGGGRVVMIAPPTGKDLPPLPASGVKSMEDFKGVKVLADIDMTDKAVFSPGPTPSIYAYTRKTIQRNLFRIPLN